MELQYPVEPHYGRAGLPASQGIRPARQQGGNAASPRQALESEAHGGHAKTTDGKTAATPNTTVHIIS